MKGKATSPLRNELVGASAPTYPKGAWIPAKAGMTYCRPFDKLRANGGKRIFKVTISHEGGLETRATELH